MKIDFKCRVCLPDAFMSVFGADKGDDLGIQADQDGTIKIIVFKQPQSSGLLSPQTQAMLDQRETEPTSQTSGKLSKSAGST